jgi:hypothetical protein
MSTVVGVALSAIGLLLTLPVCPLLLSPRDARDLTGGITGAVVVIALLLAGSVLIFREQTPTALLRVFYLVLGPIGIICGLAIVGWGSYELVREAKVDVQVFVQPWIYVIVGIEWTRRGLSARRRDTSHGSHQSNTNAPR